MDDGKSTLIGRLLHDSGAILADTLAAVQRASQVRGQSFLDLSLLTDGLEEERAQGITIDVAYRYFRSGGTHFIIADAPGHEEFTRNMVTAASTADLAVILVDATKGCRVQTLRHAYVTHLTGIRRVIVAVNKMDLVGWSEEAFGRVRDEFRSTAGRLGLWETTFIPISGLQGDMVVERGGNLSWYAGPTLLEALEEAAGSSPAEAGPLRIPVQWVCRVEGLGQVVTGRVESGTVVAGDEVGLMPAGTRFRVDEVRLGNAMLTSAQAGQSVTLRLCGASEVRRGDILVPAGAEPQATTAIEAMLCWFSPRRLIPSHPYRLRHATREVHAQVTHIDWRMDLSTLEKVHAHDLAMNDIACVRLDLGEVIVPDRYAESRATGGFILVDGETGDTVAAGMIAAI